jgi:hypothetical protein
MHITTLAPLIAQHDRKMGMWWTSPCDCAVESLVLQDYGYESGSETSSSGDGIEPEAQEMNEPEAGIEPMVGAEAAYLEAVIFNNQHLPSHGHPF